MEDDGRPIFFAAEAGNLEMVKLLMEVGTLFNVKDKHEKTPLSYAAASGRMDVVQYLASKGADVCAKDVQLANENGHKSVANFLESIAECNICKQVRGSNFVQNGSQLPQHEDSKAEKILQTYFPKLANSSTTNYQPGSGKIGAMSLPELEPELTSNDSYIEVFQSITKFIKKYTADDVLSVCNYDQHDLSNEIVTIFNCSKGFLLRINSRSLKNRNFEDKLDQITLKQEWKKIDVIYDTSITSQCENCKEYVITSLQDIPDKLQKIFEQQKFVEDPFYLEDFKKFVKIMLLHRVRIAPENMNYWTPKQYHLAHWYDHYKNVLLDSAPTTGKTILMIHVMKEMLKQGKSILYIVDSYWTRLKTLLYMKISKELKDFQAENNLAINNFKIVTCNLNTDGALQRLLDTNEDYDNIFIDELVYDDVNIKDWIPKIRGHLWIIISYGKDMHYNRKQLRDTSPNGDQFYIPSLNEVMGSTQQIVSYVKRKSNAVSKFSAYYDDAASIQNLILPASIQEKNDYEIEANDFDDAFRITFEELNSKKINSAVVLFEFDSSSTCNCYKNNAEKISTFSSYVKEIAKEKKNYRKEPVVYLSKNQKDENRANQWVSDTKFRDLITANVLVHGYSHDAVVIFQEQNSDYLEHYLCLRASQFLMIVTIPEEEFRGLCFGKCDSELSPKDDDVDEQDVQAMIVDPATNLIENLMDLMDLSDDDEGIFSEIE